ncbi:MAG: hypothetical protein HY851_10110 [candidate division Zixibacteria bacterium]|nr:hypothetical protein [candidate division Zixibacteria bacterium]
MRKLLWALAAMTLVSCTKKDYVGEEFAPTDRVDQFFAASDVTREYKVMGYIVASAPDMVSAEKMHKKLVEKAHKVGADGIIVEGLERYTAGSNTSYSESTEQKVDKKGKAKTVTTGSSSTNSEEKKQIKATLIKYK